MKQRKMRDFLDYYFLQIIHLFYFVKIFCMENNNLQLLRKQRKLSQAQVARKLNMTQSAYGKIERGRTRLPVDLACKLADIYEVDAGRLINREQTDKYSALTYNKQAFNLQCQLIAVFKEQIESLVISKYGGIMVNYPGVESRYEEFPDFMIEAYKKHYNVDNAEDYYNSESCPIPFENTSEEEYDGFKKLMEDHHIYYFFKHGLYNYEEDFTFSWCWKKYRNEKNNRIRPSSLKLSPDVIREYLKDISTENLYKKGITTWPYQPRQNLR